MVAAEDRIPRVTIGGQDARSRSASYTTLARAAVAAARRGWPVVPGTYRFGERWFGRPNAVALRPVADEWERDALTDPEAAEMVWAVAPYSLLLVCGQGVDVLELPASVVESAIRWDHGRLGAPIVSAGEPTRWLVFVATGALLLPELELCGVAVRGAGSWVTLPPYPGHQWQVSPAADTTLPGSTQVQQAFASALGVGSGAGH